MSDTDRDLVELKKEIVESRNQAIKTDNLVKNLSLDIKSFEKRFERFEQRTRVASLGANLIVAVVIILAAVIIHFVNTARLKETVAASQQETETIKKQTETEIARLEKRVSDLDKNQKRREEVESAIDALLGHIEAGREKQAIRSLEKIDMEISSPVVKRLAAAKIEDFRRKAADSTYRSAKSLLASGRTEDGLAELKRVTEIAGESNRLANTARYVLATNLWSLERYGEAIPILLALREHEADRAVQDEVRFLLGAGLLRTGKKAEGVSLLKETAVSSSRFALQAKNLLATLDADGKPEPLKVSAEPPKAPKVNPKPAVAAPSPVATPSTPPRSIKP